ncbi:MAG: histidine acid phosphatase [Bacteroidaceae bacterium]|nr:histidine acid phosphatase [Bacteroidaceae bacterium]
MKRICILAAFLAAFVSLQAQTARQEIDANPQLSGGNLFCYPVPTHVQYTAPPAGYKPFYLSAYARHGSRHMTTQADYTDVLNVMSNAYRTARLTTLGKRVYLIVDSLYTLAQHRVGDLTQVGARQHQGIAARIYRNFPDLFAGNVHLEARSTAIQRTMLSMLNECCTLQGLCPHMTVRTDAPSHDVHYLDFDDPVVSVHRDRPEVTKALNDYTEQVVQPQRLLNSLFADTATINRIKDPRNFMIRLFNLANIIQNEGIQLDLYHVFTQEELFNLWKRTNYWWYVTRAASPVTGERMPRAQRNLLRNFIYTADTALVRQQNNLTLRFGHEVDLLPFICLIKLKDAYFVSANPDEVSEHWRCYNLFPMACNVQWVFYKKEGSPVLVKILLNEREQTLPINNAPGPYYKWDDLRAYCMELLR